MPHRSLAARSLHELARQLAARSAPDPPSTVPHRGSEEPIFAACLRSARPSGQHSRAMLWPTAARMVLIGVLVQMMALDRLRWGAELTEVVDGQAEGDREVVRGSPLRPRSHHPMRALVSSVQAQSA